MSGLGIIKIKDEMYKFEVIAVSRDLNTSQRWLFVKGRFLNGYDEVKERAINMDHIVYVEGVGLSGY